MPAPDNHTAERLIARRVALFAGSGEVLYLVMQAPYIVSQAELFDAWWTPVALASVGLPAFIVIGLSFQKQSQWSRPAAWLYLVGYTAALGLALVAHSGGRAPAGDIAWITTAPGLVPILLAATETWIVCTAVTAALLLPARWVAFATEEVGPISPIVEYFASVAFCLIFALATFAMVNASRLLDRTAAQARRQSAAAATGHAVMVERRRFDALIHDGVLATLLAAGRSTGEFLAGPIRESATDTLDTFESLASGNDAGRPIAADEAFARIQGAIGSIDLELPVSTNLSPDAKPIPAPVVEALIGGALEAVRNLHRHAPHAPAEVNIETTADGMTVRIHDAGPGFDPARVPPHRLGLAVSIRGRFADIPGGWSRIDSALGAGTRVAMGWSR